MITKEELLKNIKQNTFCRIGISNIHGVGVIVVRDIQKGTNPYVGSCQCKYIPVEKEEIADFDAEIKDIIHAFYSLEGDKILIPECGINGMDISYFMNHSESPNIMSPDNGVTYAALRDIKKGEELTINYDIAYGNGNVVHSNI